MMYATVEFAVPTGGTHKQRVKCTHYFHEPSAVILAATKHCKARGVAVANVLGITHGKVLLWSHLDLRKGY